MDIINILTLQLTQIQSNLKNDLKNKALVYNYLVNDEENFLSYFKLQSYILNNECKNLEPLKNINRKCTNIIELWNLDLENIPLKELYKPFDYYNEEKVKGYSSKTDFHAVSTLKDHDYWQNFSTTYGKKYFIENYEYIDISIPNIASKCINLSNLIENQFPAAIVSYSGDYFLNHYHKTGNCELYINPKPFKKDLFDSFCIRVENFEFKYYYILNALKGKKQIEFKYDAIDHLKKVRDIQVLAKYKIVLNELIENITDDKENIQNSIEEKNDVKLSTIDDYFDDVKDEIESTDYEQLKNALKTYLEKGKFPTLKKKINLKRISRKKIGWKINRILNSFGKNVSKDVLSFAIDNISIYSTYKFDKPNYIDTNIYKNFHTKT